MHIFCYHYSGGSLENQYFLPQNICPQGSWNFGGRWAFLLLLGHGVLDGADSTVRQQDHQPLAVPVQSAGIAGKASVGLFYRCPVRADVHTLGSGDAIVGKPDGGDPVSLGGGVGLDVETSVIVGFIQTLERAAGLLGVAGRLSQSGEYRLHGRSQGDVSPPERDGKTGGFRLGGQGHLEAGR